MEQFTKSCYNNNNNNNNTSICKVHNVSIRAESEAPRQPSRQIVAIIDQISILANVLYVVWQTKLVQVPAFERTLIQYLYLLTYLLTYLVISRTTDPMQCAQTRRRKCAALKQFFSVNQWPVSCNFLNILEHSADAFGPHHIQHRTYKRISPQERPQAEHNCFLQGESQS